ncbi:anti-sigma-K factor rskA [Rhodoglobus vestalii]|uniref:Anti-sigma-K factor rskA n=1 Tax=Rhodoglobus vestalii TaxID=193384 RepID=A0A8H2K393_9MICO|nr:anti-sigma factor [Rhodoglobus vestalii]TQO18958.1 anti-sigma-K factor rskA [Rhodoglobus vestalii]
MRHVDPDILALLALGEEAAVPEDSAHLSECDQCRREVELLSRAALVGRSTFDAGDLLDPPARVWSRITDELSFSSESVILSEAAPEVTVSFADHSIDALAEKRAVKSSNSEQSFPAVAAPIVESGNVHSLEKRRRPWVGALAAAASLALVAATGSAIWLGLQPADQPTVLASATLDAFPNWSESTGEAKLERRADGTRIVEVSFSAPPTEGGFREVWLITSDATALVSLGIVEGMSGQFTVPDGLDVDNYNLVDISEEQFDGNPAHSGDSIVRGQLTVGV